MLLLLPILLLLLVDGERSPSGEMGVSDTLASLNGVGVFALLLLDGTGDEGDEDKDDGESRGAGGGAPFRETLSERDGGGTGLDIKLSVCCWVRFSDN